MTLFSHGFAQLWRPTLPPAEVIVRAAIVYGFIQLCFRLAGRSERAARLLEGAPVPLVRDGVRQREAMRTTRVSETQLLEHVRERGGESLARVKDAFLERSGRITVVLRDGR